MLILGEGAKAQIILQNQGVKESITNLVQETILQKGAYLDFVYLEQAQTLSVPVNNQITSFANSNFQLAGQAKLDCHHFTLGGDLTKHKIKVDLMESQAETNLHGLYILHGQQQAYNQLQVNHQKPACQSSQFYKGILADKSRAEFSGEIKVDPQAIKTDAKQLNQNLLLSQQAQIDIRPQLEILADDLKCAHGATVGSLQPEHLFYLNSRGLSTKEAERLLIYGFAEEIIQKIANPALQEYLNQLMTLR